MKEDGQMVFEGKVVVVTDVRARHRELQRLERGAGRPYARPRHQPGPEVRVNCISPGWIDVSSRQKRSRRQAEVLRNADHAQHPVGRVGGVEDVAAMTVFLASSQSGFVTGQNVVVDGGMTKKMIYV